MKRIGIILLVALLLSGCTSGPIDASRFMQVEAQSDWVVVADKETGVMYAVSDGLYNRGQFTLLVDADGKPLIYEGGICQDCIPAARKTEIYELRRCC